MNVQNVTSYNEITQLMYHSQFNQWIAFTKWISFSQNISNKFIQFNESNKPVLKLLNDFWIDHLTFCMRYDESKSNDVPKWTPINLNAASSVVLFKQNEDNGHYKPQLHTIIRMNQPDLTPTLKCSPVFPQQSSCFTFCRWLSNCLSISYD